MKRPKLLAVGGAHVDRRGQVAGPFAPGASNPGRMREDVGGGAFNALRNAAQRGIDCSLMSVRGADSAGENVARAILQAKIRDISAVFLDRATASYTALIDRDGDVIAGLADMELYETVFAKQLRRSKARDEIAAADTILCDANLPAAALERLAALAGGKPLFAIAISPAKVVRFSGVLASVSCLFMNGREAAALSATPEQAGPVELAERLRSLGLASGVITWGSSAVTGFDPDGTFHDHAPHPAVDGGRDRGRRCAGRRDNCRNHARPAAQGCAARRHRRGGSDDRQPEGRDRHAGARTCRSAGPCAGTASGAMRNAP